MQKIGVWHLSGDRPRKLQESKIDFEQNLEEWIEADPELLQVGLTIVGKQIRVEGGRLDLLAIDPQGRWVIIEIKREQLRRETIAQIIDYASCLATMSCPHQTMESPHVNSQKCCLNLARANQQYV